MPRTQAERLWLAGGGLAAVLMIVVAYLFFIGPQRDETASVGDDVNAAATHNQALQLRINSLDAQNKKLSTYQAALHQAELALPNTSGLPDFLRTLQSIGNSTLIDISSLSVGAPALVAPAAPTADTTVPGAASTTPTPTPTASSATSGPQFYSLPITLEASGSVAALTAFLGQLQSVQPRAVLVSSITLGGAGTAVPGSGVTTLQLTMSAFVAPASLVETQQLAQAANK